jgi:hypothetical protein
MTADISLPYSLEFALRHSSELPSPLGRFLSFPASVRVLEASGFVINAIHKIAHKGLLVADGVNGTVRFISSEASLSGNPRASGGNIFQSELLTY